MEHASVDGHYKLVHLPAPSNHLIQLPAPTPLEKANKASATRPAGRQRPPTRRPPLGLQLPSPLNPAYIQECDAFRCCEWRRYWMHQLFRPYAFPVFYRIHISSLLSVMLVDNRTWRHGARCVSRSCLRNCRWM
ncbi:hypothetical protein BDR03DRAFT_957911 [Suillus americanus]|nr:hypothetical protein BDR03DRAFT_957911 [Suillus americanus]